MKRLAVLLLLLLTVPLAAHSQGVAAFSTSSTFTRANASGGTTLGTMAKLTATGMLKALTTDTSIPLFLTLGGAGTSGNGTFLIAGPGMCLMDATNASGVAGYYVVPSGSTAGDCHAQVGLPASGQVLGTMIDDATTSGATARVAFHQYLHDPATGAGSGTVTSAAMTVPAELSVAGSPITTTGTFAVTKATQTANTVWAGPTTGSAAQPAFRLLVAADIPAVAPSGTAGGSLGGTYPNPTVVNAPGAFSLTGDIRPTALSGNVNDYTPTNGAINTVWYIDGGAADRTISGLYAGTDGEIKALVNYGTTNALLLPNQSASSSATGRFLFGGDVYLAPGESQTIMYDSTGARWKPLGAVMLEAFRIRACNYGAGSPSASSAPLASDDAINDACPNDLGRDVEILSVSALCNNTGVVLTPILTGGSSTSILTGALTCGTNVWSDGVVQTTRPVVHSFSGTGSTCSVTPCSIGNTWTTTGLATEMKVKVKMRMR